MRHQRHFPQPRRALVGVDQVAEGSLALLRRHLHDAPALEAHPDAIDQ